MKTIFIKEDDPFVVEAKRKRSPDDKCWCGVDKQYKDCHLSKEHQKAVAFGQALKMNDSHFKNRKCMHPDQEDCRGKKVKAHTIQKKGSLKDIVDLQNHCLTFKGAQEFQNGPFITKPRKIGWNEASTFLGFCQFHDRDTFKDIETFAFTATMKQCFLLYYRALCHELYQKESLVSSFWAQKEILDNGKSLDQQINIQMQLNHNIKNFDRTVKELTYAKSVADKAIVAEDYHNYSSIVVKFSGELLVCGTGHFLTDQDIEGNYLYDLYDTEVFAQGASLSLVKVAENENAFIVTWPKANEYTKAFAESILQLDNVKIIDSLFQILIGQIENVYFSKKWWIKLDVVLQHQILLLANDMDFDFSNIKTGFKPKEWSFVSIEHIT